MTNWIGQQVGNPSHQRVRYTTREAKYKWNPICKWDKSEPQYFDQNQRYLQVVYVWISNASEIIHPSTWNFAIAQNPRNLMFSAQSANPMHSAKSRAIFAIQWSFLKLCVFFFCNWRLITKFFIFSCEIFTKINFGSKLLNVMLLIYFLLKEAQF